MKVHAKYTSARRRNFPQMVFCVRCGLSGRTGGARFDIDRVVQVERAASRKAGGVGLRYTVMIGGKRHHLYYEDNFKWFVEAKTSV